MYVLKRRGIVNIWMAIVAAMLILLCGLAVDAAYLYLVSHQLQNAADASSLAAVRMVRGPEAVVQQRARDVGGENHAAGAAVQLATNQGNSAAGDIVIGRYDRATGAFTPTLTGRNAVKVVARRNESSLGGPVGMFFGPMAGVDSGNVSRYAIAMVGGSTGAGLIVLNQTDDTTFRVGGTITLDVRDATDPDGGGAGIHVNSSSPDSLKTDGSPEIIAGTLDVVAREVTDPPEFDGELRPGAGYIGDPLGETPPPPQSEWGPDEGEVKASNGNVRLTPTATTSGGIPIMYLSGGIRMTGGSLTLDSGIYVLGGSGFDIGGNAGFVADGVMLYVVAGPVDINGSGTIDFTGLPMDVGWDPYGGIAIWQDAANTTDAFIAGTADFESIDGLVYIPNALLEIAGTSDSFGIRQVICDSIWLHGSGMLNINYDGLHPAPGNVPFLVE